MTTSAPPPPPSAPAPAITASAPLLGSSPPTYKDVYGKIIEARDTAKDGGDFMQKFCDIICGTLGVIILVGVTLFIPVTMIAIGSINIYNCPAQRFIPIWLVVAGTLAALMQVIYLLDSIIERCTKKDLASEATNKNWCHRTNHLVLGCFWFAWFIAGNVWVFSIYRPNTHGKHFDDHYCDHVTYYLALTIILLVYFITGFLSCTCSCIWCCCWISIRKRLNKVLP